MAERRVALITGASRGIGETTAQELARRGFDVGITGLEAGELAAVARGIEAGGAKVFSVAGDLTDLGFAKSFAQEATEALGVPHVLVNNAAGREVATMREISIDAWEKTLRLCLTAPAFLARWAAEQMEPLGRGVIINISSIKSARAIGMEPAYVAAKGGLDALTYELAALYGPAGIRVVAVNPGAVDTGLSHDIAMPEQAAVERELRDWSNEMISLRRWAPAQEIARTIAWLAADDASYITGTTIVADGGWSRQLYLYSIKHKLRPEQFP